MLMKFSTMLAVVIVTMMNTNEAVKLQDESTETRSERVTKAIFKIADENKDKTLSIEEFKNSINELYDSDEVPGTKK